MTRDFPEEEFTVDEEEEIDTTESAVYTVHLDIDPEKSTALRIYDAMVAEGFEVHAVKRADVKGLSEIDEHD